jgi:aromatic-L-amino-acid decarboxylase
MPHEARAVNPVDRTLEYSRPFRSLKLWLALRVHGAGALRAAIERNLAQARLLTSLIAGADDLEGIGPPDLTIVPFRHVPAGVDDLDAHNLALAAALQEEGDLYVAPASIDGTIHLRPCFVNFRTTDADVHALVDGARTVGERLARRTDRPYR